MRVASFLSVSFLLFSGSFLEAKTNSSNPSRTFSGASVLREINLARQSPQFYANYLEEWRDCFHGNLLLRPGRPALRTHEGVRAVDEAIRFLRNASPLPPLIQSNGITMAARDHVAEQAGGGFGHDGKDHSNPGERMNRYGTWGVHWGENLSYGRSEAREMVLGLIVDDGLSGRKHRKNIFNPVYKYAGAAVGYHARYRTVCSIDFAGTYAEAANTAPALIARN